MIYTFNIRDYNKKKPFFPYEYKDYSFKVDLKYGELYFTKKLISFSGQHLPLNLSLKYSQTHTSSTNNLHSFTGFPKGFKTNYHVVLRYELLNDKYIYEDLDGFKHEFKPAINSSTLYYDTFGTGLMLTNDNGNLKIFDDDGSYQLFDSSRRLITIHRKITSTSYAEQSISYIDNNSLKISSITDNFARTIYFSYSSSSVQITYNNNVVVTLFKNNNLLTKISKSIGDNHLVEETFTHTSNKLSNITFDSGESFSFSYSSDKLTNFVTNIKQDVFSFSYGSVNNHPTASVTNARGIKTEYDFSQEQLVANTLDNNSNLGFIKINSDVNSCLVKDVSNVDDAIIFNFSNDLSPSIDTSSNTSGNSNYVTNLNIQPKKMYLFVVEINSGLMVGTFKVRLLDYSNHLLAELAFTDETRVLSFPVGICSTTQKTFRLHYVNDTSGSVEILNARLIPLIGDFELLCSNVNLGGPIFFYGDEPHYLLKDSTISMIGNDNYAQYGYIVKKSDLLANERNLYKNNMNHFWANDKKVLISNASSVLAMVGTYQYIGFSTILGGLVYLSNSLQTTINLYRVRGNDNNSFSITKFSHNSSSFHTGYSNCYYEEEETMYSCGNSAYLTYYDYDNNYSLVELNRSDGYKEEYDYDSRNNLIGKIVSHTSIDEIIKNEYDYYQNDNLQLEKKLIGSSIEHINYGYDSFGNITRIDYPQDYSKLFDYDTVTGERNLNVSFDDNDSIVVEQDNNYIDEQTSSISSGNNEYQFSYYAGELLSVSYNDQQIVGLTHYTPIHSGYPLNTRYVIQYMNGYYATCEKDAFDRVISNEGLLYTYDAFSRITNIYDDTLGGFNPNTSYTYDYYSDLQSINVESNGLSLSLTRDIYHRVVTKNYSLNNSGLYTLSYTYYTKPGLENAIEESEISYGSTSVGVIDNVDDFSRLTSQSVSFGNYSFNKSIDYYTGGPNNLLTNNMVKSVTYEDFLPYPLKDTYSYDARGNVNHVTRTIANSLLGQIDYIYDTFSRLVRENNALLNKTYTHLFDSRGNIIYRKEYAYSTSQNLTNPINTWTYQYDTDFPNRLIKFNNQDIEYDVIGNPTLYKGKTMSWTRGALLSQVIDGGITINLTYDGFKQRVSKTVNNIITNYLYIDKQLLRETKGNQTITYLYSHGGIIGFVLSGYSSSLDGVYFYEKNIMQDVESIRNSNNQIVAIYQYDAWGNHKVLNPNGTENTFSTFIGNINPIRYRSYYYDTDLKMYWLTTRYYDPEVGRFISPDHYSYLDYKKLHGINLYAYSRNNPVMYCDPSGHRSIWSLLATIFLTMANSAIVVAGIVAHIVVGIGESINNDKSREADKTSPPIGSGKGNYLDEPYRGDGFDIYYNVITTDINGKPIQDPHRYILIVDESWRFTDKEIDAFLNWLKYEKGYNDLNIERVKSEWKLHNAMYGYGLATDSTRRVDIYLNASDDKYGWFFDFYYFFFG